MTMEESSNVHCHWKVVGREHNIVHTLPLPFLLPSSPSPSPFHSLPLLLLPLLLPSSPFLFSLPLLPPFPFSSPLPYFLLFIYSLQHSFSFSFLSTSLLSLYNLLFPLSSPSLSYLMQIQIYIFLFPLLVRDSTPNLVFFFRKIFSRVRLFILHLYF